MSKKSKMVRVRHPSLEMNDPEVVVKNKKQDMLTKARNKLFGLSDVIKSSKTFDCGEQPKKTMTQTTIDCFFKNSTSNKERNHVYTNTAATQKKSSLQKQNSVGSYPIKIEISNDSNQQNLSCINRIRPATVCGDRLNDEPRETAALALERPRKKLSFREPEVMGHVNNDKKLDKGALAPDMKRSISVCNGILHRTYSVDDFDLESQAMRIVRTIGQAFEVCHKLSINAPENENQDQDEQDTLTQDLLSDRLSDITNDKQKKDIVSEGASDKLSLPPDDASCRDSYSDNTRINNNNNNSNNKPNQVDLLPPPPQQSTRKSPLAAAETYSSPHSDILTTGSGSGSTLPPPGSALSAHHELQLMREQLEQQTQQTQAALAQLQLAREQLAAEQSARLEAQARTHQLLIHNRELLDHIAALVAHLQGGEKSGQQQSPAHVTMPQQQHQGGGGDGSGNNYATDLTEPHSLDNSPVLQALGLNPQGLIENRAVTATCLPSSPHRTTFNPSGQIFNFPYHHQQATLDPGYDPQLFQRLQNLTSYPPPSPYHPAYNYAQTLPPYLSASLYNPPLLNNNYTLQPPPKKMTPSPITLRHSLAGSGGGSSAGSSGSPVTERKTNPGRNSEPRLQSSSQNLSTQPQYQSQQNLYQYSQANQPAKKSTQQTESQFIKPLSQIGTLTTTDPDGRLRVIVPVPGNSSEDTAGNLLANLRVCDDLKTLNGPAITRSTSEKVPNRSELMSQVQRTMWARHTTK